MFSDYYSKYLAVAAGNEIHNCLVCRTFNRDNLLNRRYVYRIIITDYNGKRILSVSPSISENTLSKICLGMLNSSLVDTLQLPELKETGFRISMMYRMTLNRNIEITNTWRNPAVEYLSEVRKYVIRNGENIISYCKISNIDNKYGNIVIWTDERYRRYGLAKELLLRTVNMCYSEGIEPIYLVDSQNVASIELAKSVGFETVQTEIIGCEICQEVI